MKTTVFHSYACALMASLAVSSSLLFASPCNAQSGKGANSAGAANTVEGTGRGAGGPGDGEGPGQGAGQGLGPGRKKDDQKQKPEKDKPARPETKKEEREKPRKEKEEREKPPKDQPSAKQEEKPSREKDEHDQPEKKERDQKEKPKRDTPKSPKEEKPPREKDDGNQPPVESGGREEEKPKQDVPSRKEDDRDQPSKPERPKDERDQPRKPEDKGATDRDPQPLKPEGESGKPLQPVPAKDRDPSPEPPRRNDVPSEQIKPSGDIPSGPSESRIVPDVPSRDVVPRIDNIPGAPSIDRLTGNIPGASQVDRITGNLPVIGNSRDGLFGFLFGGKKAASPQVSSVVSDGKQVLAMEKAQRINRARGAFLGIYRIEIPNLFAAAKADQVMIDPRVTSPRTVTYKSRLSRVSRWVGPLTLGLINYIPFETMNDAMSARINNLMADEEISVEKIVADSFAQGIKDGKRFKVATRADAVLEAEVTRYALDPMPTSLGRMKPTVSVTGRMFDANGQLLWLGKGFSTIVEPGIKGATVEQYEDNPAMLRADFGKAARAAVSRLAAQANALPRAKITVVPASKRD